MANTIKTVMTYTLDGSTREYNIPFEYLARKFVSVTLIGVDRQALTLNSDYRFASQTVISLNRAWGPADGYTTIEFRRYTSATERLVDFTDGSILRAYDLNIAQVQTMHVAEEARDLTADTIATNADGQLDARGRRIVNLADGLADGDAISVGQVKRMNENSWQARNESLQFRNEAEQFRNSAIVEKENAGGYATIAHAYADEATASKVAAADSESIAKSSATDALSYRDAAWQYQDWAKGYKESAEASANIATAQADRAKTEADKLGNWNGLAGAIRYTNGADVVWRGAQRAKSFQYNNDDDAVIFNTFTDGTNTLYLRPETSVGNPIVDAGSSAFRSRELNATGGVVRLTRDGQEFNMTLEGGVVYTNRTSVDRWAMGGLSVSGVGDLTGSTLRATGAVYVGNALMGPEGNITGSIWTNGSLKGEMLTKCTYDDLNNKVDNTVAFNKYLVDVGHGAQTANPLNNHQGGWEVAGGHSIVGFFSTTSDGNIRYTNWMSRCLMKRTEGSGWIQCGNIA